MGARIESVATSRSHKGPLGRGALHLSDAAARKCLDRAGHGASDIDLLVNAGLYKDRNMAEPALASIIQEDIGANPGHPPRGGHHGTFSFDVINGGCGVVSAAHLVDAFVGTGVARLGLVVAGDADPGRSIGFPFPPVGGAMLVRPASDGEGFVDFAFETFEEADGAFESAISWHAKDGHLPLSRPGKHALDGRARRGVRTPGDRVRRGGDAPVPRAARARGETGRPGDLQPVAGGVRGRPGDTARPGGGGRLGRVPDGLRGAHTAGPIVALDAANGVGAAAPRRGPSSSRPWARASWWGSRLARVGQALCAGLFHGSVEAPAGTNEADLTIEGTLECSTFPGATRPPLDDRGSPYLPKIKKAHSSGGNKNEQEVGGDDQDPRRYAVCSCHLLHRPRWGGWARRWNPCAGQSWDNATWLFHHHPGLGE